MTHVPREVNFQRRLHRSRNFSQPGRLAFAGVLAGVYGFLVAIFDSNDGVYWYALSGCDAVTYGVAHDETTDGVK